LSDELVRVTVAGSEAEAAVICGYLESRGIRATYDKGGVFQPLGGLAGEGLGFVGRQEILVRAGDLEAAKAALDERPD
jgi:hypothetical protein